MNLLHLLFSILIPICNSSATSSGKASQPLTTPKRDLRSYSSHSSSTSSSTSNSSSGSLTSTIVSAVVVPIVTIIIIIVVIRYIRRRRQQRAMQTMQAMTPVAGIVQSGVFMPGYPPVGQTGGYIPEAAEHKAMVHDGQIHDMSITGLVYNPVAVNPAYVQSAPVNVQEGFYLSNNFMIKNGVAVVIDQYSFVNIVPVVALDSNGRFFEQGNCPICTLGFTVEDTRVLPCRHAFHGRCVYDMVIVRNCKVCPICKVQYY